MEIKTVDEYVLKELVDTKHELHLAQKRIDELLNETRLKDNEVILKNETKVIYMFENADYYDFNRILKQNDLTPLYLKEILEEKKSLDIFCNYEFEASWGHRKVLRIMDVVTNYAIKISDTLFYLDYYKYSDGKQTLTTRIIDKENFFDSISEAEEYGKKKILKEIENYFKYKKDEKFEEE